MSARTLRLVPALAALALGAPAPAHAGGIIVSACGYSHSAYDDPIVHRGHPGHSHRHDFFGNRSTGARSTARSLRRGGTTCFPRADRAAYWAPSLFKRGRPVRPSRVLVYYLNAGGRKVRAFPPGLKMVAGDQHAERFQEPWIVNWSCDDSHGTSRIPSCRRRTVTLHVTFPSCWDGRRRDSRDHRSHMAYRRWDWRSSKLVCPDTHPVAVPTLVLNVTYPIRNGRKVWLASGRVRTAHADFFNGWRQGELERLTRRCLRKSRRCLPGR